MRVRFERPYDVYAILGDPARPPPWSWDRWPAIAAHLDPLVAEAGGGADVECDQFNARLPRVPPVPFGKLGWSAGDHAKWAHGSPLNAEASRDWHFFLLRLWAPGSSLAARGGEPPELFLGLENEAASPGEGPLAHEERRPAASTASRRPRAIDTFPIAREDLEAFFRERSIPLTEPALTRVVEQAASRL